MAASHPFRDSASFGKRIEYWVIGRMLKEGWMSDLARIGRWTQRDQIAEAW